MRYSCKNPPKNITAVRDCYLEQAYLICLSSFNFHLSGKRGYVRFWLLAPSFRLYSHIWHWIDYWTWTLSTRGIGMDCASKANLNKAHWHFYIQHSSYTDEEATQKQKKICVYSQSSDYFLFVLFVSLFTKSHSHWQPRATILSPSPRQKTKKRNNA